MHLLDVLDALDTQGSDFIFSRFYQQIRIISSSGMVLSDDYKHIIQSEKKILLDVMQGGIDYSPTLLFNLCEARIERLAIQNE